YCPKAQPDKATGHLAMRRIALAGFWPDSAVPHACQNRQSKVHSRPTPLSCRPAPVTAAMVLSPMSVPFLLAPPVCCLAPELVADGHRHLLRPAEVVPGRLACLDAGHDRFPL